MIIGRSIFPFRTVVWLPLLICVELTMTVFQLPWVITLSWLPTAVPLANSPRRSLRRRMIATRRTAGAG